MCLLCRTRKTKPELFRLTKDAEGLLTYDATQKKEGRGAYLCRDERCLEKAVKKNRIPEALAMQLKEEM